MTKPETTINNNGVKMKVYIGPYKNWVGPYQLAELLLKVGMSEDLCDKFGDWLDHTQLAIFCDWIDSKKKRKIQVRIDKYDTWSMDKTLAYIILPMLQQLKEVKHGTPEVDDRDVPKKLRSTLEPEKENEWDVDDNWHDRWDWVLDEMIWAFTQVHNGPGAQEVNQEDLKAHNKRMQNGLELFGKYYYRLWD